MARPSKYEVEWRDRLIVVQGWATDGLSDEQIAHNMGIATSTLYEWKKKHREFSEALKKGKEIVDREVENALLKRALGYKFTEITTERRANYNAKGILEGYEMVETKRVVKEVQPDTTAQIFWLKNRKPEEWRDTKVLQGDDEKPLGMPKIKMIIQEDTRTDDEDCK
ncbi:transposase [Myroides odoratimimus]|uniref:transposase n=1 Tax=Myroides odoratimimus TaxID=76832 RepID=UPI002577F29A|nr:transposase [Myroides odoratimimus]MDM1396076.1 transposase [Myroides odoratimimus]